MFNWLKKNNKNSSDIQDKYKDSDADGLLDTVEKHLGTNPNQKDSDADGLNDYEEVNIYGTDPLSSDSDKDGMSDGDEVKMGRNPLGPGSLKDFFIPHEKNKYCPLSLKPKRLAFYAISTIIIKVIVVGSLMLMPVSAWLTPDILKEQSKKIIELTNTIRTNLGKKILLESNKLNLAASNKADDMLVNQYFAHINLEQRDLANWLNDVGYNYSVAGENLAMGFASAEDVVNAWSQSGTHYANMIDPDFSEIGVGMASGLYNNYETTLVAQYFGFPKKMDINNIDKENLFPEIINEKKEKPIETEKEIENQEVLSIKKIASISLETPELISFQDNFTTSENEINLDILAPQAEKIIIYSDNYQILEQDMNNEDVVNLSINLEEGKHILILESISGEEISQSQEYSINVDNTPPVIQHDKTYLTVVESASGKEKIVKAVAYLYEDAVMAEVDFNNYHISLSKNENEPQRWTGEFTIFKEEDKQLFNPVVLANLTAQDASGNTVTSDIQWVNITPVKTSLIKQYTFAKKNLPDFITPIFTISLFYYKILLVIAILALILNIFCKIKKQRPKVIFSALGFIGLLTLFILI